MTGETDEPRRRLARGEEMREDAEVRPNDTVVLHIDDSFTFGGAIYSLFPFIRRLKTLGFSPTLISGQSEEFIRRHLPNTPVRKMRFKLSWNHQRFYRWLCDVMPSVCSGTTGWVVRKARFAYWLLFHTIPQGFRYYLAARRIKPDLIHLNNSPVSQLNGMLAARLLGVPAVCHVRGGISVDPVVRFYCRLPDHLVAVSRHIKSRLLENGVPQSRVSVVPNPVDTERFQPGVSTEELEAEFEVTEDQLLVGIVGRVRPMKGIAVFLRAMATVMEDIPNAGAFVVGDDPPDSDTDYLGEMRTLAAALDIEEKVVFTGHREDIPAIMTLLDVVVLATTGMEGFGRVLAEAMACETPVVSTRCGGPMDVVADEETGLLVDRNDVGGMAAVIARLLQDEDVAREMGKAGRALVVEEFSEETCARKLGEVFERTLSS